MENGDEQVQNMVKDMLNVVLQDAMSPGQNRELIDNFNIKIRENEGILVTTPGQDRY